MKEIVVISGKGGTGKTSMVASFACLAKKDAVLADCDVDAADLHLLLESDFSFEEDFYSGELAFIDKSICRNCGRCAKVCRFDAIDFCELKYTVDEISCEGCGYCARVCIPNAITMNKRNVGKWYISTIKTGAQMVHAKLGIGAENSGKLVAKVKSEAKKIAQRNNLKYVIIDGSPGIGCPVVSSLSGANFVVLVTEPTQSGLHDLKRVYGVVEKFNLKAGCIINKCDINDIVAEEIEFFLREKKIEHIGSLPHSPSFTQAMIEGLSVVEYTDIELKKAVCLCWDKIEKIINKKECVE
ncbi:MAG: ATP-binding protein [Sulfurospirillaceae bacterium]|nr:ATP-binding protein [Sulfurospirillaceae bacterium]